MSAITSTQLLVNAGLPPPLRAALQQQCGEDALRLLPEGADGLTTLSAADAAATQVYVTTATHGADAALMDALPQLRAICSLGVGLDAIDMAGAKARGIRVSNTPDVLNDCVADLAIGLMLDVARGISQADRHVRRGDWPRLGPTPVGRRVSGAKLGLLGMGGIGQAIARRAAAFDMPIRYHTRRARPELPWAHESDLQALAQWCDVLIVACAGGKGTRGLVSAQVLEALGADSLLVNVARGSVIDEAALVDALQQRRIGGAGLDVFMHEPQVPEALFTLDNVVLLPHIGSATAQTRRAMGELLLRNVQRFLSAGELETEAA